MWKKKRSISISEAVSFSLVKVDYKLEFISAGNTRKKKISVLRVFEDSKRGALDPIFIFPPPSTFVRSLSGQFAWVVHSCFTQEEEIFLRGRKSTRGRKIRGDNKSSFHRTIPLIVEKLGKKGGTKRAKESGRIAVGKIVHPIGALYFSPFSLSFFLPFFPPFFSHIEKKERREGILELSGLAKILSQRSQPSCPRKQKSSGCCSFVSYPFSFVFHPPPHPPSLPFFSSSSTFSL